MPSPDNPNKQSPNEKSDAEDDLIGVYSIVGFCIVAVVAAYFLASLFFAFILRVE